VFLAVFLSICCWRQIELVACEAKGYCGYVYALTLF